MFVHMLPAMRFYVSTTASKKGRTKSERAAVSRPFGCLNTKLGKSGSLIDYLLHSQSSGKNQFSVFELIRKVLSLTIAVIWLNV